MLWCFIDSPPARFVPTCLMILTLHPHDHRQPTVWPQSYLLYRPYGMARRQLKCEMAYDGGQNNRSFLQGESRTNAGPWPDAEREIRESIDRFAIRAKEPAWVEAVRLH